MNEHSSRMEENNQLPISLRYFKINRTFVQTGLFGKRFTKLPYGLGIDLVNLGLKTSFPRKRQFRPFLFVFLTSNQHLKLI